MKTFNFKWMAGMLLVMLCMGLSSCSDDDDDVDPSSLIGTWQKVMKYMMERERTGMRMTTPCSFVLKQMAPVANGKKVMNKIRSMENIK